jgi:hypothetical protein
MCSHGFESLAGFDIHLQEIKSVVKRGEDMSNR